MLLKTTWAAQFNFPAGKSSLRERFPPPARLDVGRPGLSDAGFDLLNRLLALDPARRISAEEARHHAWCAPSVTFQGNRPGV